MSAMTMCCSESASLLCTEVLDLTVLGQSPVPAPESGYFGSASCYPDLPPTVRAVCDRSQMCDRRILQNLLRNEDMYVPPVPDYVSSVQAGAITPAMRKIVADWMLEVVHEQNSQPEVFCLAVNIMDRFLCHCRIAKSQLQLLGSACILISSKIREPCPIPGKTLITYTDYSITAEELKEWELLVLYKLQWELSAITPMDYLDHALPRLGLDHVLDERGLTELRRRTETILVLAATEYQFAYSSPSLMAAAAIITALQSLSLDVRASIKDVRLTVQTIMHTPTGHIDALTRAVNSILPDYLKTIAEEEPVSVPSPDSSSDSKQSSCAAPMLADDDCLFYPDSTLCVKDISVAAPASPQLDLACSEQLSSESVLVVDDSDPNSMGSASSCCLTEEGPSRSSSPLSAVDIFTDFNTNVLQAVFEQAANMEASGGYSSILVR